MENLLYEYDEKYNKIIVGIDEAGRGPLAGPVVAAATILKEYDYLLNDINDSKKLTEKKREKLFDIIKEHFIVGVGMAMSCEIDKINILNADFLAMRRAFENLKEEYKKFYKKELINEDLIVLVDGNLIVKGMDVPQKSVVKGDGTSLAIAAASIIAKVTRDRLMIEMDSKYPEYGFAGHKGYGTKKHYDAIKKNGICAIHRKSFLKNILTPNPTLDFGE